MLNKVNIPKNNFYRTYFDYFEEAEMIKRMVATSLIGVLQFMPAALAEEALDPEKLFSEAMDLKNTGYIYAAIDVFETILDQQPGLNRARLELAVAYHKAQKYKDAKEQLNKVLNDPDTPESVKLTITGYLAQLDSDEIIAAKRTSSTVYVSAGLFTDSNANLGPNTEITNVTSEQSGTGMVAMASYSHTSRSSKPLDMAGKPIAFEWRTQATGYAKAYSGEENDFNLQFFSVGTGPVIIDAKNWNAKLNFKIDKIYYSGDPYAFYIGLNPSFTYIMDNNLEFTVENKSTIREFSNNPGLEGISKMYGFEVSKYFKNFATGFQLGTRYHSNGADDDTLNYTGTEIYIGAQTSFWENGQTYLRLGSRNYDYLAGAGTAAPRDETEVQATLGASHKFSDGALKSWKLNGQVHHVNNDSNDPSFDYDQTIIEVNLRKYF